MVEEGTQIRVRCRDCTFEKVVTTRGDTKPADVLIDHGRQTGHTLTVSRIEER